MTKYQRYNRSEKGKARYRRYDASPKGRARLARYSKTAKGMARMLKYGNSPHGKMVKAFRNSTPRYLLRHRLHMQALRACAKP